MSSNLNLNSKEKLYCRIRKEWVTALPEEKVRQGVINQLIDHLGFPLSTIALEKKLDQMPHLPKGGGKLPSRRADIICFAPNIHSEHSLYPLVLIECKAVPLTAKVVNQVVSYNHYVKAYFLAIANGEEIKFGWYDKTKEGFNFQHGLPSCSALLGMVNSFGNS